MSDLTPCNACTLARIRREADRLEQSVSTRKRRAHEELAGWIEVRVDDEVVALFMELTVHCAC